MKIDSERSSVKQILFTQIGKFRDFRQNVNVKHDYNKKNCYSKYLMIRRTNYNKHCVKL